MTYSTLNTLLENDYTSMMERRKEDIEAVRLSFHAVFDLDDKKLSMYYDGGFGWDIVTDNGLRASVKWEKKEYVNDVKKTLDLYPSINTWIILPTGADRGDLQETARELQEMIEDVYDAEWTIKTDIRKKADGVMVYVSGTATTAVRKRPDHRAEERNQASMMSPRDRYNATPGAQWQASRQARARSAGMDNFGGHDANYRN